MITNQFVCRTGLILTLASGLVFQNYVSASPPAYHVIDLGKLGEGVYSYGIGLNAGGLVSGDSYTMGDVADGGAFHAFRYDGAMHDLGTLGGTQSQAFGINDSGQVAGYSHTSGDVAIHAFLYDVIMYDIGTLGGSESSAFDINSSGQITGGSSMAESESYHAFLCTVSTGMVDLNSCIDPLTGWELQYATGINDSGQIAGSGLIGGEQHAFLLIPLPEPANLALVGLGLPLIVRRHWRSIGPCRKARRAVSLEIQQAARQLV